MRRQSWILLAGASLLVLLAGCLGALDSVDEDGLRDDEDATVAWHEAALPHGDEHDHANRSHHEGLTTPNFHVRGYNPLFSPFYDAPAGSYFCGDAMTTEDDRRLAVVESRSQVGFAIADVTDPDDPRWLGELVLPSTHVYDLAVAPDGEHVILATSNLHNDAQPDLPDPTLPFGPDAERQAAESPVWISPCNDEPVPLTGDALQHEIPRPMSALLVSIEDPEEPQILEQQPLVGNGHSVFIDRFDGEDWVMITTSRTPSPQSPPVVSHNAVSAYEFFRLQEAPHGATMERVTTYSPPPDENALEERPLGPRGHDGWMNIHPATGDLTAYLAGGERFTILDMSTPRAPQELSRWSPQGPGTAAETGLLHSAWAPDELWNDRHFTLIGPEHHERPGPYPTGLIWALDTTDPTDPQLVAGWTLPAPVEWNGTYMFSNHYFTGHNQTLYVSQYHGGLWAVDMAPLQQDPDASDGLIHLDSIGAFIPDREPPQEPAVEQRWAPTLEEALAMPDGTVVTFDGNAGLYVVDFDEDAPMPAPEPWPVHDPTAS